MKKIYNWLFDYSRKPKELKEGIFAGDVRLCDYDNMNDLVITIKVKGKKDRSFKLIEDIICQEL